MAFKQFGNRFNFHVVSHKHQPDKLDYWIAVLIGVTALAAYIRTLAPDILYGDSAEFQSLAYTLGITHSTGYPTYLLLGRLVGFLPVNNPAWRISLLSAICAGISVGGIYLLARNFTVNRIGPVLGGLVLAVSYTFWSQAIIAEVYTPGMAFTIVGMILLFRWQDEPQKHNCSLLTAACLAGIGFGVHASVWLFGLPAVILVIWRLWNLRASRTDWIKSLSYASVGAILGLLIFLVAFMISDKLNSPTSFIRTTLEPSRVLWDLETEDFDSTFTRLKMTVISVQWGNALFPGGDFSFTAELDSFIDRLLNIEFSPVIILLALIGSLLMLFGFPTGAIFLFLYSIFSSFFILNYQVSDKNVFYLSLYIPLSVAVGSGVGFFLEWTRQLLKPLPGWRYQMLYLLPVFFFITIVFQPSAGERWGALREGAANFVTENYVYPIYDLGEPRLIAERRLAGVQGDAVFVLDWRALFTTAYIAHVEKGWTNTLFFEAMPYGNHGEIAPTLIAQLAGYLEEGRPVYADQKYPGLEANFRLMPSSLGDLYKLTLRE